MRFHWEKSEQTHLTDKADKVFEFTKEKNSTLSAWMHYRVIWRRTIPVKPSEIPEPPSLALTLEPLIAARAKENQRAERRAGELLKEMKERGERDKGGRGPIVESSCATQLSDLGITRDQSSKWQKLVAS